MLVLDVSLVARFASILTPFVLCVVREDNFNFVTLNMMDHVHGCMLMETLCVRI